MNKFTLIIHNKGWKVLDACEHWGIRYATYNARCNSDKFHNQLECMCNGLELKQKPDWLIKQERVHKILTDLGVYQNEETT